MGSTLSVKMLQHVEAVLEECWGRVAVPRLRATQSEVNDGK